MIYLLEGGSKSVDVGTQFVSAERRHDRPHGTNSLHPSTRVCASPHLCVTRQILMKFSHGEYSAENFTQYTVHTCFSVFVYHYIHHRTRNTLEIFVSKPRQQLIAVN